MILFGLSSTLYSNPPTPPTLFYMHLSLRLFLYTLIIEPRPKPFIICQNSLYHWTISFYKYYVPSSKSTLHFPPLEAKKGHGSM